MDQFETRTFGDVTLVREDCLVAIPKLNKGTVDLVFLDLPYGATRCAWDSFEFLEELIGLCNVCTSEVGLKIFSANMQLAAQIISLKSSGFKYDIVWQKSRMTGFLNANRMPLRSHEHLLICYSRLPTYHPQMRKNTTGRTGKFFRSQKQTDVYGRHSELQTHVLGAPMHPHSVVSFAQPHQERGYHPTQKPIALLEWLIRTYTNDGDTILDPVAGSATTAIAAMNVGKRKVICIEKDPTYFEIMTKRVADHQKALANAEA